MNILIASPIYSGAIEKLRENHDVICAFDGSQEELCSTIADREVLVFRSGIQVTADVLSCAPNLRLIVRAGSGIDNIDVAQVEKQQIKLIRVAEPGAKAVAEMSFALMLALSRNLMEADRLLRQGHWAKHELTGHLLNGKVLGILGLGSIGTLTGERGVAWGMDVLGCVGNPTQEKADGLAAKGIRLCEMSEVLRMSDYLSISVPLNSNTRNLIDSEAIAVMKPGVCLVNLARGGVVDEVALYQALISGHISGAGMDVHADEGEGKISPLAELPNTILTPHIGASTIDSQREIGKIVIDAIES
ncbi:MAG: NAD(P)-dependent oxidoreductase [Methylococcales bacterium]